MLISVFTDASCCETTGLAAWAGWVKSQRGVSRSSGVFKQHIGAWSYVAEAMAVLNACHAAVKHGVIADGDQLLVQTDNNRVPLILGGGWRDRRNEALQHMRETNLAFAAFLGNHELSWRWRWVQAQHTSKADASRDAVNKICNDEALRQLRAARGKLALGGSLSNA